MAKPASKKKTVKKTKTAKKPARKPASKKPAKKVVKSPKKILNAKKRLVRVAAKGAKAKALSQKAMTAETLIEKGKERGYVTYNEILKAFPHVEDDVNFLESLYERFAIAGVDVLEGG